MSVTIDNDFHRQKHFTMGQLSEIRDGLEEEIRLELEAVMQKILADAISLCPKDTGALASSISLESGVISAGDFAGYQIFAGSPDIINPKSGKPTSEYASMVHDGHALPNGSFYEGVPFLEEAIMLHFEELERAVERALKELGENEPSAGTVAEQENVR